MLTAITDARILTPDEEIERGTVLLRDGRIESDEWNRRRRFVHAAGPGVLP